MIHFDRVTKTWPGGPPALTEVSFDIAAGEFVVLTGHSGAGKTSVLKLLAGIERPTSGQVLVHDHDIGAMRAAALPWLRRKLGLVLQDSHLLTDRSALANVMLPLLVTGQARRAARERARAALERVGLAERARANPLALSGGDQQRLAIARAIVNRPMLLIADEPTANLDRAAAAQVLDIFRQFHAAGVTVLIATHDPELCAGQAGRILRLNHGRLLSNPVPPAGGAGGAASGTPALLREVASSGVAPAAPAAPAGGPTGSAP